MNRKFTVIMTALVFLLAVAGSAGAQAPPQTLLRAATIGKEAGLRYIYAGNLPGRVRNLESTFCPACGEPVVERLAYRINQYRLEAGGRCPKCSTAVPGVWW